jgi:hypothetical protein
MGNIWSRSQQYVSSVADKAELNMNQNATGLVLHPCKTVGLIALLVMTASFDASSDEVNLLYINIGTKFYLQLPKEVK